MQANHNEQDNRIFARKKIFLVICVYFLLTITSRYVRHDSHNTKAVSQKIIQQANLLQITDLYQLIEAEQIYTGRWTKATQSSNRTKRLSSKDGHFQMSLGRKEPFSRNKQVRMEIMIVNGNYIDEGTIFIEFIARNQQFQSQKGDNKSAYLQLLQNSTIDGVFVHNKLMITQDEGTVFIELFEITFKVQDDEQVLIEIKIKLDDQVLQLNVYQKDNRLIKLTFFAVVTFVVSYMPFVGVLSMLKGIYNGSINPLNISLWTVTMSTMWDSVVCVLAFKLAFEDQQSLVLFIMPAFMLCLLFSNLEPRLILAIFQNQQHRGFLSYNMLSYGSLLLIYPLILLTNLNRLFFLSAACMLFPQIYLNALNSVRPQIKSSYYLKFVLSRYLLVIYLKFFPYNVFRIQPDMPLVLICSSLVGLQYILLKIQHLYGPKTIIPNCLLQPTFDYGHQEIVNLEEGEEMKECSICLTSLSIDPPEQVEQNELIPRNNRLMKTPCSHTYHSSCLLSWMKIKMVCPQCRSSLPPFQ